MAKFPKKTYKKQTLRAQLHISDMQLQFAMSQTLLQFNFERSNASLFALKIFYSWVGFGVVADIWAVAYWDLKLKNLRVFNWANSWTNKNYHDMPNFSRAKSKKINIIEGDFCFLSVT